MSRRLVQRTFVSGGYYHIFNRGNNKKKIFFDERDYTFFTRLFDCYLLKKSAHRPPWITKHFEHQIKLIAYCLMPNHFHILVHQKSDRSITEFLRAITIRYTKYFNKRYDKVGHVFQGKYKARLIKSDGDLVHLSRYIHRNPAAVEGNTEYYPHSSLKYYLSSQDDPCWLKPNDILSYFSKVFGSSPTLAREQYRKYVAH